ncbi:MAG: class I tRNA ligase family protein, partial [Candidatus Liptonbacteria bacterium]|nr:class I tRNA ligase family protein [Candidatus Liptonbacteria bacterium]
MKKYDFRKIEKTWQDVWAKTGIYRAQDFSKKPKFYPLVEFPYPSGAGLHVGHVRSYTAMDVLARKRRMEGQNVLYPIGWDAFGLPTENYAVKTGIHPAKVTRQNSDTFRRQLKRMGFSFDWSREVNTTDPEYYKWTQWIFLQLYKHGLAYKAKSTINWCPSCKIGLANEEVVASKCERCGAAVEEREKEQWMLRITKYADKLLKGLETVNFLPRIRSQQENWIGRSEGAEIQFPISNYQFPIPVFTTRPDTLFGATYMVLSPEHPLIEKLKDRIKNLGEVKRYIQRAKGKTEAERIENREKTGVELRGIKAINPANGKKTPIFVADYVLSGYGTGAIMAVPAHDERDYEFARKFKLPIRQVIAPYFSNTEGKDAIRSDKKTVHRHTAYVLLRHSTRDKYLCLDWEKFGWHSGIIGGIDPGEDPVQAAKREILEETGYRHVRFVRYVGGEQHNHFFATHKDENRYAFGTGMLFELTDEKKAPVELEHTKNHQPVWIEAGRMESWLNLASFQYIWQVLKSNQECFTGNGVAINSGKFNGLNSEEAKWQITTAVGGKKTAKYHLRDWIFSRQRYWGEPIPMIYCEQCAKKPKVLILHGLGGNSRENWLPWAKREL